MLGQYLKYSIHTEMNNIIGGRKSYIKYDKQFLRKFMALVSSRLIIPLAKGAKKRMNQPHISCVIVRLYLI
jgi:hypothetical protein